MPANRGQNGSRGATSQVALRACVVALWVVVWQLASMVVGSDLILAGPVATVAALVRDVLEPTFWSTVLFSAVRILGGLVLALLLAGALALGAHASHVVRALAEPALAALKSAPVACMVVLLLIWAGSDNVSLLAVLMVVLPAVYFPALEGLDAADGSPEGEMLRGFGVGAARRLLAVGWPVTLGYVRPAARSCVGMGWKAGVAAELIGIPTGSIGERIFGSKLLFDTADLFAWTIVIVLLARLSEKVVLLLLDASGRATPRVAVRVATRPAGRRVESGRVGLRSAFADFGGTTVGPLTLDVAPSARLVMTDPSGSGKTCAIRLLAAEVSAADPSTVECPVAPCVVHQDCRLVETLSAVGNVRLATGTDSAAARALLAEVLPADALDRSVAELSGGMRRRVELVRALAADGDAVLLDEPFASLDAESRRTCCDLVKKNLGGRALVVAAHEPGVPDELGAAQATVSGCAPDCY